MRFLPPYYSYKRFSIKLLAQLVDILLLPISFFIQKNSDDIIKQSCNGRFLIINCGGIGDLVLMEPLIRYIHLNYPYSSIDVLVRSDISDICCLIDGVDGIITFDYQVNEPIKSWLKFFNKLRKELKNKYIGGFDVKGDPFAIMLMLLANIPKRFGFSNGGLGGFLQEPHSLNNNIFKALANIHLMPGAIPEEIDYSPKLISNVENLKKSEKIINDTLLKYALSKVIVVSLGAGEGSKLWTNKNWQDLLEKLSITHNIIIVGRSIESDNINFSNKNILKMFDLPLLQSVALIKRADMFIGLDTGLSHIAAAFLVPTVCLFSLSHSPKVWAPQNSIVLAFTPPAALDLKPMIVYDEVIRLLD